MKNDVIPIVEVFGPSIQGEGPNAGARCIFVRVKGCTYACKWCDSKFTWKNHDAEVKEYTPSELIDYLVRVCNETRCKRVVLTGGNPCMYDFKKVIFHLHSYNINVDVETQGDLLPDWLYDIDTVVFSPKGPSSGMPDTFDNITSYIKSLSVETPYYQNIAIKVPIFSGDDIEFARKYSKFVEENTKNYGLIHDIKMYLSVGNSDVNTTESIRDRVLDDYEELLDLINQSPEDFDHVFILPQIHTLVWGNKQGV